MTLAPAVRGRNTKNAVSIKSDKQRTTISSSGPQEGAAAEEYVMFHEAATSGSYSSV
jgi:hypothetical protein